MAVVQVRDVPEDVHADLVRQAQAEGKSLNKYLLEELRQVARKGRNREVLERAAARPRPTKLKPGDVTATIRAMRDAAAEAG